MLIEEIKKKIKSLLAFIYIHEEKKYYIIHREMDESSGRRGGPSSLVDLTFVIYRT